MADSPTALPIHAGGALSRRTGATLSKNLFGDWGQQSLFPNAAPSAMPGKTVGALVDLFGLIAFDHRGPQLVIKIGPKKSDVFVLEIADAKSICVYLR